MGFTTTDLHPDRISVITPPGKYSCYRIFEIASDEGSAQVTKVMLPASSSVISVTVFGNDAGGTGDSIAVAITKGSSTISSGTFDLETNGAAGGQVSMSGLPNIGSVPQGADLMVKTTSTVTSGGPWKVLVEYVD